MSHTDRRTDRRTERREAAAERAYGRMVAMREARDPNRITSCPVGPIPLRGDLTPEQSAYLAARRTGRQGS